MKLLVLLIVLLVAAAWLFGRGRRGAKPPAPDGSRGDLKPDPELKPKPKANIPAPMLACAHCGVHLPRADASFDTAGQPYCGAEHRVAGPR